MAKQDDYVRYTIRVPADIYRRLQESAGEKSINAEVVARLDGSFGPPAWMSPDLWRRIEVLARQAKTTPHALMLRALEAAFPEPITVDRTMEDIRESMRWLRTVPTKESLVVLADQLDELLAMLEGTDLEAPQREAVQKLVDDHMKRWPRDAQLDDEGEDEE